MKGPTEIKRWVCNGCEYLYTWTNLCPSGEFFAECKHPGSKMSYWMVTPNNIGLSTPRKCPVRIRTAKAQENPND